MLTPVMEGGTRYKAERDLRKATLVEVDKRMAMAKSSSGVDSVGHSLYALLLIARLHESVYDD